MNARTSTPPSRGRAYRGQSSEARRAERRERLIEAGLRLIGTQGYRGTTVRALCTEAGLTERYFYESFTNQEALLCAVYRTATDRLQHRLTQALAQGTGDEATAVMRGTVSGYFQFLQEHPGLGRIMMTEILGVSPQVDELYRHQTEQFSLFLHQIWQTLLARRPRQDIDSLRVMEGLVGAMIFLAMGWMLRDYQEPLEQMVDSAMVILMAVSAHVEQQD